MTDKIHETQALILAAKMACDRDNREEVRRIIEQIRNIWVPRIFKSEAGAIQNTMVALGWRDWIEIDVWLPRMPGGCEPVTVSIVGDRVVNPEASGQAAEEIRSEDPEGDEPEVALVFPANAAQAFTACTYSVPPGTTFNARFGEEWGGISLGGSIAIAQTAPIPAGPAAGTLDVGLPTDVSLTASLFGQTLTMKLDKTCPYNTLRLDANGNGTLGVALKLDSDSRSLVGLVQVGSTIYFRLPVAMSPDWSTLRIHADRNTPGDAITPTVPILLDGADGTSNIGIPRDRCGDDDGNRIRDGADAVIYAIRSQLNCDVSAQH